MHLRAASILLFFVLAWMPDAHAAAKKNSKAAVSFHMQAESIDNPKMIFPYVANGEKLFFRRMPDFSVKDFTAFSPFPSSDNDEEYGIIIRLKPHIAQRLANITSANQGRQLVSMINGRAVDSVMINERVNDGVLIIWKGISAGDLTTLDKALPRIGEEKSKKNKD